MASFFLIALIFLSAVALYLKTTEEIPQILALAAIWACCIFALVLAPWELQLILLLSILIGTRKIDKINPRQLG